MISVYKDKGDALECGSYRGIKLFDQVMKAFERVIERQMRNLVSLDDMQFGFRPGRGIKDAIFIVRQIQEKFLRPMDSICGPGEGISQSSSRRVVAGVEAVRS